MYQAIISHLRFPLYLYLLFFSFTGCKKAETVKLAAVSTAQITDLGVGRAKGGGIVTSNGGADVTARGVCWSTSVDPTTADSKTANGVGNGPFDSELSGLVPNTTYYIRAYAINSAGISYGESISFLTGAFATLKTSVITEITGISATTGGVISDNGRSAILSRGVCWSTTNNPTIMDNKTTDGLGSEAFVSHLSGLAPNTSYYVRAYATNLTGTGYGPTILFKTNGLPVVSSTLKEISDVITINGDITDDGRASIVERGICFSLSPDPTIADEHLSSGTGIGAFDNRISTLQKGKTYYIKAYATNSVGTGYSQQIIVALDLDGNIYRTVKIGTQIWMLENLKTTKYRNGDPIPNVTRNSEWENLTSGAYSNYDNYAPNGLVYGRLYNYYVVADPRKVCPEGWHIPTDDDWRKLTTQLGGNEIAGGKMKEAGTSNWKEPNSGSTNSSGFTALPAGGRAYGGFYSKGEYTYFFADPSSKFGTALAYNGTYLAGTSNGSDFPAGHSIRCIKDQE